MHIFHKLLRVEGGQVEERRVGPVAPRQYLWEASTQTSPP